MADGDPRRSPLARWIGELLNICSQSTMTIRGVAGPMFALRTLPYLHLLTGIRVGRVFFLV